MAYYPTYWSFEMPAHNVTLTVTYNEPSETTYNITKTGNGASYVICASSAPAGTTIRVIPTSGHGNHNISISSSSVSPTWTGSVWTFTMPAYDVTLTITYNASSEAYNIIKTGNGASYVTCPSSAPAEEIFTITPTSGHGYTDIYITDDRGYSPSWNGSVWEYLPARWDGTVTDITFTVTYYDDPSVARSITKAGNGATYITVSSSSAVPGTHVYYDFNWGYELSDGFAVHINAAIYDIPSSHDLEFIMPPIPVTITVTKPQDYDITKTGNGAGYVNVSHIYAIPGTIITVTPTSGYGNHNISISSSSVSPTWTGSEWTFIMPSEDVSLTVTYNAQPQTYNITKTGNAASYVTLSANTAAAGTTITVTPTSGHGNTDLSVWSSSVVLSWNGSAWTFTMPSKDVTITISTSYPITLSGSGVSKIDDIPDYGFPEQTVMIYPKTGYTKSDFTLYTNDADITEIEGGWYFIMPSKDVSLTVTYTGQ